MTEGRKKRRKGGKKNRKERFRVWVYTLVQQKDRQNEVRRRTFYTESGKGSPLKLNKGLTSLECPPHSGYLSVGRREYGGPSRTVGRMAKDL